MLYSLRIGYFEGLGKGFRHDAVVVMDHARFDQRTDMIEAIEK